MYTFNDYLNAYLDVTKDDSPANMQRGIRAISQYYDRICASGDYHWLQKAFPKTTVASQPDYEMPKNCRKVIDVSLVSGGIRYVGEEITDFEKWDKLQRSTPIVSDSLTHFHIRFNKIYLYPTPASRS